MATVSGVLHELDFGGDSKIQWDADNSAQVEAARAHFDALRKKNYLAFRMNAGDTKGTQLDRFDENAERILMVPPRVGG